MRLIDSPAVQSSASRYMERDRDAFLDAIRYDGVFDEVATNMRVLIRRQGLTQRQVAERLGTSETALSRMLRGGNVRNVKFGTVVRFAKAVGVDVLTLFDLDLPASAAVLATLPKKSSDSTGSVPSPVKRAEDPLRADEEGRAVVPFNPKI